MSTIFQKNDRIQKYLEAFDFSGLFVNPSTGWDPPPGGGASKLKVPTHRGILPLDVVAQKRGVSVLVVPPDSKDGIPPSAERKAIEKAVTPLCAEHLLIFVDRDRSKQVWQWTSRIPGQPIRHRELTWEKGRHNTLLQQKIASISFTLDEEETLDVTGVVHRLRDSMDRDKVTKRFYERFKKEKDAFRAFIEGLTGDDLLNWYTSLMLNRLMFCYFLQRQGFLDGDLHYLRNRLAHVRDHLGSNQFHSFYRSFLRRLFHEGLGQPEDERERALRELIGKVPYLNGGIFEEHRIERDHPELHIPDEAFQRIFEFLDQYDWHLDVRPIGNDREIDPEILGYVFEKYTNQKEMGAYYTKEDITEYISKNCIIPFLLDSVKWGGEEDDATDAPAFPWNLLSADPDRYIYPAVRHGAGEDESDWRGSLPEEIAIGLDVPTLHEPVTSDRPIQILERRKHWNTPAPPSHGLKTEIWRETIARHQRCHELRRKLREGEVRSTADLITFNLDIRQFAEDVIEQAGPRELLALFKAVRSVSVLDPTCGSGAFLFAALNILEPLYRGCLDRMRVLLDDWETTGEKHPVHKKEFSKVLDQVSRHPNEDYWVFKSIIVHNLYGVDIMEEAVEICKLRLFLKLAAQLRPGHAIEPLPDIDFNIRAGNTLVGYTDREEVRRAVTDADSAEGRTQMRLPGMEFSQDEFQAIEEEADSLDRIFRLFQDMQDDYGIDPAANRDAKTQLTERLAKLRDRLDRFLAQSHDARNVKSENAFEKWQSSHQPFHWFVEFYGILNKGGFDVVIGNPPYMEYKSSVYSYKISDFKTSDTHNLYAYCSERSYILLKPAGLVSLIVPLSIFSTPNMMSIQTLSKELLSSIWVSYFSNRPAQLFEGAQNFLTIFIGIKHAPSKTSSSNSLLTTSLKRWTSNERHHLFEKLHYTSLETRSQSINLPSYAFPKFNFEQELGISKKLFNVRPLLSDFCSGEGKQGQRFVYCYGGVYWTKARDFESPVFKDGKISVSSADRPSYLKEGLDRRIAVALLNSSLHFWFWSNFSDCRNKTYSVMLNIPVADSVFRSRDIPALADRLMEDYKSKSERKIRDGKGGRTEFNEYYPKRSKVLIDEIDTHFAAYFGFTEEELDFIINYDIKYRIGLGASPEDD